LLDVVEEMIGNRLNCDDAIALEKFSF